MVLVQAAPSEAETRYLLGIAERWERAAGVVGWVDMAAKDAPDRIAALAEQSADEGHPADDPRSSRIPNGCCATS